MDNKFLPRIPKPPEVNGRKRKVRNVIRSAPASRIKAVEAPTSPPRATTLNPEGMGDDDGDVEARVLEEERQESRVRFLEWMESYADGEEAFKSVGLFCEMVLRQVMNATKHIPSPSALRITVCSLLLEKLIPLQHGQYHDLLLAIKDQLFSGIYMQSETGEGTVSVPLDVAALPRLLALGPDAHYSVRKLTRRTLYTEHTKQLELAQRAITARCESMTSTAAKQQVIIQRAIGTWQIIYCGRIFVAWRNWHRDKKRNDFVKARRMDRFTAESDALQLSAYLTRWRLHVESEKLKGLKERETNLQYQISNSKTQFSLQCFKTERYLKTIEDLRDELIVTGKKADDHKVARAKAEAGMNRDTAHRNLMWSQKVQQLAAKIADYSDVCHKAVAQLGVEDKMRLDDVLPSDWQDKATLNWSQGPHLGMVSNLLLKWCNAVLISANLTSRQAENFAQDFCDGENLTIITHHLLPQWCTLRPLKETDAPKRVELCLTALGKAGLGVPLTARDVVDKVADLVVVLMAELFVRYAQDMWTPPTMIAQETSTGYVGVGMGALGGAELENRPDPHGSSEGDLTADVSTDAPTTTAMTEGEFTSSLTSSLSQSTERKKKRFPSFDPDVVQRHVADVTQDLEHIRTAYETLTKEQARWRCVAKIVSQAQQYLMTRRAEGHPVAIADHADATRVAAFVAEVLGDSGKGSTAATLEDVLRVHHGDLHRVYHFYVNLGVGSTLGYNAFWRFCLDCRLPDRATPKLTIDAFLLGIKGTVESAQIHHVDLSFTEFVESLVRIANSKFAKAANASQRMQSLMQHFVLPRAAPLNTTLEGFRKEIYTKDVQQVLHGHASNLHKVFRWYTGQRRTTGTMTVGDLMTICRDASVMDHTLTDIAVAAVYAHSQVDDDDDAYVLCQFAEAVVGLAVYKNPCPFLPLAKRVDHFLSAQFLPSVASRMRSAGAPPAFARMRL